MECFYKIPSDTKNDPNTNTITQKRSGGCTFYGSIVIPSTDKAVYTWKFKIIEGYSSGICIGIDQHRCKWTDDYFYQKTTTRNYGYYNTAWKYRSGEFKKYGSTFGTNDIITMVLDLSSSFNSALYFMKNGKNQGTAYINIKTDKKIKYRMAVSTYVYDHSIRLLSYSCIPITDMSDNNDNDAKNNYNDDNIQTNIQNAYDDQQEMNRITQKNSNLSREVKRLTNEYDKLRITFSQKIKQITNELDQIKKENLYLNKDNNDLNQKYIQLQSQNATLIENNQLLKNNYNKISSEYNKLKQELKLSRLNNLDENKYLNWNTEQVVHWIISLDYNSFIKYKQILIKSLNEESVDGECLDIITENDIKSWGIKNMKHRKFIYKKILKIVKNNNDNMNMNMNDNNMNDNNYNAPNANNNYNDEGSASASAQTPWIG